MNRTIDQAASGRCVLAYLPEGKVIDLIGEARAADLAPRFAAIRDADGLTTYPPPTSHRASHLD